MAKQPLSLTLATNVAYVSGTVNGVSTVWTNTGGNIWETEADRAANDVYLVELEIITTGGQVYPFSLTLFLGLHLITWRTKADVDRVNYLRSVIKAGTATAEEVNEYLSAPIGGYCSTDLNRVNTAVNMVAAELTAAGYPYNPQAKVSWTDAEEFLPADLPDYLAGVAGLRSIFPVWPTTPAVPADIADYQQANDLEKIIEDVHALYRNMVEAYFYLGDLYLGEV